MSVPDTKPVRDLIDLCEEYFAEGGPPEVFRELLVKSITALDQYELAWLADVLSASRA